MTIKSVTILFLAAILPACASGNDHRFQMDYPVQASRLSVGGEVSAFIDCVNKRVNIISDTSGGILSRHVKKRVNNICYRNNERLNIIYKFDPVRGVKQDLLSTQPNRSLPVLNTNELSEGNS